MDAMLILAAIILGLAFLVFFLVRKPKNGPADTAQIKSEQTSKLEANKKAPKKTRKSTFSNNNFASAAFYSHKTSRWSSDGRMLQPKWTILCIVLQ